MMSELWARPLMESVSLWDDHKFAVWLVGSRLTTLLLWPLRVLSDCFTQHHQQAAGLIIVWSWERRLAGQSGSIGTRWSIGLLIHQFRRYLILRVWKGPEKCLMWFEGALRGLQRLTDDEEIKAGGRWGAEPQKHNETGHMQGNGGHCINTHSLEIRRHETQYPCSTSCHACVCVHLWVWVSASCVSLCACVCVCLCMPCVRCVCWCVCLCVCVRVCMLNLGFLGFLSFWDLNKVNMQHRRRRYTNNYTVKKSTRWSIF